MSTVLVQVKGKEKILESKSDPLIFSKSIPVYLLDFKSLKMVKSDDLSMQSIILYLMGQTLRYGWNGCDLDVAAGNRYIRGLTYQEEFQNTLGAQCALAACYSEARQDTYLRDKKDKVSPQTHFKDHSLDILRKVIKIGKTNNIAYAPALWAFGFSYLNRTRDISLAKGPGTPPKLRYTISETQTDGEDELAEAIAYLQEATKVGFTPAMTALAYCYLEGFGVKQNYHQSFLLVEKAALAGHAQAKFYLGFHYQCGFGTAHSQTEANRWFKAASDQGYEVPERYLPKTSCVIM